MITDIYQCPICGVFVERIYRINVVTTTPDQGSSLQAVFACGACFKPMSASSMPQEQNPAAVMGQAQTKLVNIGLPQLSPNKPAPAQEDQEQAELIEYAKQKIRGLAIQLGIDVDTLYKKAYRVELNTDTNMDRLSKYHEKLDRQIAAAKAAHQAGQKIVQAGT